MQVRFNGGHGVKHIRTSRHAEPVAVGQVVDLPRRTVRELRSRGYHFESVDGEQIPEAGGAGIDARAPEGPNEASGGRRSRADRAPAATGGQSAGDAGASEKTGEGGSSA